MRQILERATGYQMATLAIVLVGLAAVAGWRGTVDRQAPSSFAVTAVERAVPTRSDTGDLAARLAPWGLTGEDASDAGAQSGAAAAVDPALTAPRISAIVTRDTDTVVLIAEGVELTEVAIGQMHEGFTLVDIAPNSTVFEAENGEVVEVPLFGILERKAEAKSSKTSKSRSKRRSSTQFSTPAGGR